MITLPLAVGFVMNLLMVLWVLTALFLIFIILIQKGKGGGLSSAFGGMGASSLLGTKTGDALTWITIGCVGLFLVIGVVLVKYYKPSAPTGLRQTTTRAPGTTPTTGDIATTPDAETTGMPVEATPASPATGDSSAEAPEIPATPPAEQPAPAAPGN